MVDQFINSVVLKLCGDYTYKDLTYIKQQISLVAKDYDIVKKSTELSVWHGQLPECYKVYMVTKHLEGAKDTTLNMYKLYLEDMFMTIHKPVEEITTNDLRVYLFLVQKNRKICNRTLDSRRSVLSSFFGWASAEGYLPMNPMLTIKPIKYERKERVPLTDLELEKVRDKCLTVRERAMVEVLYSTGCRVTELIRLDKDDVDFHTGEVILFGKGDKHRKSYLSARAQLYLTEYLKTRNDDNEPLFVSLRSPHDRLSKAAVEKAIRTIGDRVNISHLHPHIFRHTIATNCLNRGMDVTQLRDMLGHTSVDTTMIYAKVKSGELMHSHRKYVE